MLVYHAVFFICSALVLIAGQRRDAVFTLCFTFSFFLILFLVGFRYAATDYFTYWRIFDYIERFSNLGFFLYTPETGQKPHETLFSAIILLTKSIGFDFYFFIFLFAFVSLAVKFFTFYKMSAIPVLTVVLYCAVWLTRDLGQMRSGMAGGFMLLSLYFIFNSSYLSYLFSSYLAVASHTVGAASFLLVVFNFLKKPLFAFFVLIFFYLFSFFGGISPLVVTVLQEVFNVSDGSRIVRYYNSHRAEGYSPIGGTVLMHLFFSFVFLFFYKRLVAVNKYNIFLVFVFVYGFVVMLMFIDFGIAFYRIRDVLVMPVFVVLLPSLVCFFKGLDRLLVCLVVIAFAYLLFLTYQPGNIYQNILFSGVL